MHLLCCQCDIRRIKRFAFILSIDWLFKYLIAYWVPHTFQQNCIFSCCISHSWNTLLAHLYPYPQALTTLIEKFPKEMASQLSAVLPHVWNILTHGAERYHKTVVNFMEEADDPVDSDGKLYVRWWNLITGTWLHLDLSCWCFFLFVLSCLFLVQDVIKGYCIHSVVTC